MVFPEVRGGGEVKKTGAELDPPKVFQISQGPDGLMDVQVFRKNPASIVFLTALAQANIL